MEPDLPIEFIVQGTAISAQSSSNSKETWKADVERAAREVIDPAAWALSDPVSVIIYIFPAAPMQGDIDNRVKPILDAMNSFVYCDDEQVEGLLIRKIEPDREIAFQNPSETLLTALEALDTLEPIVYVRISHELDEELN